MKLDRRQDFNFLYHVCVFWADRKNKMAALASDWLRIFYPSSETAEQPATKLDSKNDINILYQVCAFWANWKNKMAALANPLKKGHLLLLRWNFYPAANEFCYALYFVIICY